MKGAILDFPKHRPLVDVSDANLDVSELRSEIDNLRRRVDAYSIVRKLRTLSELNPRALFSLEKLIDQLIENSK